MQKSNKPVVLVVLDGWGIEAAHEHNGVHLASTPCFDTLAKNYPYTELQASGEAVGLPDGQMGNSEVGHTTIGAGTVIYQDLVRISQDCYKGEFGNNPAIKQAFTHVNDHASQLHIMGLLSTGGVHSHEDHLIEVAKAAKQAGVKTIVLHPFLDGRDSAPTAGAQSLAKLEKQCEDLGNCFIATVIGRYYAMDRDTNWDRTDKAFNAIWHGKADRKHSFNDKPAEAIKTWYEQGVSDEHIEPLVFHKEDNSVSTVQTNDAIIFTNFRSDRARQLSKKICDVTEQDNLHFVTMTDYGKEITCSVAYEPQSIEATLASAVADAGLKQAHLAETEKFPHATYFLNGGKEDVHAGEEHVMIPSNKHVKTHDEAPEMKAKEICDAAIERLDTNDFLFVNFANPDMVGHTAKKEAIIIAVETVDRELKRLSDAVLQKGGALLAIADHGNAERMLDPETGAPHTAHTTNPVPCILVSDGYKDAKLRTDGGLKDVAPTILDLMNVDKPTCMTGESLVQAHSN